MLAKKRNQFAIAALFLLVIATTIATWWLPISPTVIESAKRLRPPSGTYWFGTDHFGRDIFGLTIFAARVSLIVGASVALIATFLGTITGLISAYYKKVDFIMMRIVDGMLAFPSLLLALALVAALG